MELDRTAYQTRVDRDAMRRSSRPQCADNYRGPRHARFWRDGVEAPSDVRRSDAEHPTLLARERGRPPPTNRVITKGGSGSPWLPAIIN